MSYFEAFCKDSGRIGQPLDHKPRKNIRDWHSSDGLNPRVADARDRRRRNHNFVVYRRRAALLARLLQTTPFSDHDHTVPQIFPLASQTTRFSFSITRSIHFASSGVSSQAEYISRTHQVARHLISSYASGTHVQEPIKTANIDRLLHQSHERLRVKDHCSCSLGHTG